MLIKLLSWWIYYFHHHIHPSVHPPIQPDPSHPSIRPSTHPTRSITFINLSIHSSIHPFIHPSSHPSINLLTHSPIHPPTYPPFHRILSPHKWPQHYSDVVSLDNTNLPHNYSCVCVYACARACVLLYLWSYSFPWRYLHRCMNHRLFSIFFLKLPFKSCFARCYLYLIYDLFSFLLYTSRGALLIFLFVCLYFFI